MKFGKLKGKLPEAEGASAEMPMEMEMEMEAPEASEASPGKAMLASLSDDELLAELERRKLLEGGEAGPAPEMEV